MINHISETLGKSNRLSLYSYYARFENGFLWLIFCPELSMAIYSTPHCTDKILSPYADPLYLTPQRYCFFLCFLYNRKFVSSFAWFSPFSCNTCIVIWHWMSIFLEDRDSKLQRLHKLWNWGLKVFSTRRGINHGWALKALLLFLWHSGHKQHHQA